MAIPVPGVPNFLKELLQWAMDYVTTDAQARAAFQSIASIVNKHPEGTFLNTQSAWVMMLTTPSRVCQLPRRANSDPLGGYLQTRDTLADS